MATVDSPNDLPVTEWPEWAFFKTETELLANLAEKSQGADPNRVGILFPLLDSVSESASTLHVLAVRGSLRDAYVVSRVIYETALNACFVLTNPVGLSDRASRHAKQKALRSLHRSITVAGSSLFEFKHQAAEALMADAEHKLLLDEFTSNSGKELSAWTPESVQQKLDAVHSAFGKDATIGLAFGMLLYRHASEIAHGTLYGTLFSWGAMEIGQPLTSPDDMRRYRHSGLRHLLKLVCFTLESLVRVGSTSVDALELAEAAEKARHDFYRSKSVK